MSHNINENKFYHSSSSRRRRNNNAGLIFFLKNIYCSLSLKDKNKTLCAYAVKIANIIW